MHKILIAGAEQLGLNLSELQVQQLLQYLNILRQWNKIHNLCADASYQQMIVYHLLDSISVAANVNCQAKNILDVGTGAGLPGIVLAILAPSSKVTLLDAKLKKITFINHVVHILELQNIITQAIRIEKYTPQIKFDLVISRAFASLTDFVKLSARLCDDNGILIAMKASADDFELESIVYDNYKIVDLKKIIVPGIKSKRSLVIISKQNNQ